MIQNFQKCPTQSFTDSLHLICGSSLNLDMILYTVDILLPLKESWLNTQVTISLRLIHRDIVKVPLPMMMIHYITIHSAGTRT